MNYKLLALLILSFLFLSACNDEEEDPNAELEERLNGQIEDIEAYLSDNNITTTVTNGYYLEQITENPDGDTPEQDDVLSVYYQIQTLDGNPIAELSADAGDSPDLIPFNNQRIIIPVSLFSILSGMRSGEEVRAYLPFNTAYTSYELPGVVPAFSAVILELQLVDILSSEEVKKIQDTRIKAYLNDNNLLPADSLEGGVYYHQVDAGQAPEVKPESNLEVRYTGRMLGGYVFDSNIDGDTPLPVNISTGSFVSGFETALLEMSQGEKGITVFPADQGYGTNLYAMPDTVSNDLQARRFSSSNLRFFGALKPIRFDLEIESVN